jgi:hypothetical protein
MRENGLRRAIDAAVAEFTELMLDAVRGLPLDELSALRGEDLIVRPEPEPEPKPKPKGSAKRRRHPKCAFPGCERNRFVRGHGYCGKHWKRWKRGELPDAEAAKDR